jgi:hypothetical protein
MPCSCSRPPTTWLRRCCRCSRWGWAPSLLEGERGGGGAQGVTPSHACTAAGLAGAGYAPITRIPVRRCCAVQARGRRQVPQVRACTHSCAPCHRLHTDPSPCVPQLVGLTAREHPIHRFCHSRNPQHMRRAIFPVAPPPPCPPCATRHPTQHAPSITPNGCGTPHSNAPSITPNGCGTPHSTRPPSPPTGAASPRLP